MVLIFLLNSIPGSRLPSAGQEGLDFMVRQAGHVVLHAVLGFLVLRAAIRNWNRLKTWILALMIAGVFSILVELYQYVIPGRNPNGEDILYNLVGVGLGFCWARFHVERKAYRA